MLIESVRSFGSQEISLFIQTLRKTYWGRIHSRDGYRDVVNSFCIVNVVDDAMDRLIGHLSGPRDKNAEFELFIDAETDQVFIRIHSAAPAGYKSAEAYREITAHIARMMKKAGSKSGGNAKNLKGYYLRNAMENGVAGDTGRMRVHQAARAGVITESFKSSCLSRGFGMSYYA